MVVVTAANVSDQTGAKTLFAKLKRQKRWFKRLFLIYGDGTYGGRTFVHWVFDTYRLILEVICLIRRHLKLINFFLKVSQPQN